MGGNAMICCRSTNELGMAALADQQADNQLT
jgi:hypothetical protein